MANTALNRTTVVQLLNKSGSQRIKGDVVVINSGVTKSFITTTSEGYTDDLVGIVLDATIADNAVGTIALAGWVPQINLDTTALLGDYVKTSTVAGQGTPVSSNEAGVFAQVLQAKINPEAVLFGSTTVSAGSGGAWTLISDQIVASPASIITFASIPGTYKHLKILGVTRLDAEEDEAIACAVRLNDNNTGTNYNSILHEIKDTGLATSDQLSQDPPQSYIFYSAGPDVAANVFAGVEVTFHDYASTAHYKTYIASSNVLGAVYQLFNSAGTWTSTAAITKIELIPSSYDFSVGSRFSLYGIN